MISRIIMKVAYNTIKYATQQQKLMKYILLKSDEYKKNKSQYLMKK